MRKITFIFVLVFALAKLQAQDYQISFEGSGAATTVETVEVQNLTQGTYLNIDGSDVLHLLETAGIMQLTNDNNAFRIYPNPMINNSNIEFEVPKASLVVIELFDITGKKVASIQNILQAGLHTFKVSDLSRGIYTIRIKSDSFTYSGKIISYNSTNKTANINYVTEALKLDKANLRISKEVISMQYNDGDLLLFRGMSGDYATVSTLTPTSNTTVTFNFVVATDDDGNNYGTVEIGTQIWMTENLKYAYASSTVYPDAGEEYGRLYDWDEALAACPAGWHLPSDAEWTTLTSFLGGESVAGQKLKETGTAHWLSPSAGTNAYGFTALPGGGFINYFANFSLIGEYGMWWSDTELTEPGFESNAYIRNMLNGSNYCNRTPNYKGDKLSVRCLKD